MAVVAFPLAQWHFALPAAMAVVAGVLEGKNPRSYAIDYLGEVFLPALIGAVVVHISLGWTGLKDANIWRWSLATFLLYLTSYALKKRHEKKKGVFVRRQPPADDGLDEMLA